MTERRKVILNCPCGELHSIPDPGSTAYLRCINCDALLTYECESTTGHILRNVCNNKEYIINGREVIAGRKAPLQIPHPMLSRHHCLFTAKGKEYLLTDLDSRNETWVNNVKITPDTPPLRLSGGDLIKMADLLFRYLSPNGSSEKPRPLTSEDLEGSGLELPDLRDKDGDKMIGKLLGEYRILSVMSQGGMGRVYRAECEPTGKPCVVKSILPENADDDDSTATELLQRFLLEMELSLHLSHPNIIQYYDIGQVGKALYITMEYFPGRDLKSWYEHTPATYEQVLQIGIQASQALAYAHSKGIIHRDIKPENILYNFNGQVKIIDFGIAKGKNSKKTSGITVSGALIGTLRYMSPEQLNKEMTIDHRIDIYSLGATLYYCLAGRSPFNETAAVSKIKKKMRRGVPPLSKYCRGVPPLLAEVIEKAVQTDPDARFQNAAEMTEALHSIKL